MKMLQQTKSNAQVEGVHNQQSSSPPSADKLNDIVTTEMARYSNSIVRKIYKKLLLRFFDYTK